MPYTPADGDLIMVPVTIVDAHDKGQVLIQIFDRRVAVNNLDLKNFAIQVTAPGSQSCTVSASKAFPDFQQMKTSQKSPGQIWRDAMIQNNVAGWAV